MTHGPAHDPQNDSREYAGDSYRAPYDLSPGEQDEAPPQYPPSAPAASMRAPEYDHGGMHHAPADWGLGYAYQSHSYGQPPAHSGLGIASVILAALAGITAFVVIGIGVYMEASTPGGLPEDDPAVIAVGCVIIVAIMVALVGLGLGVAGCLVRDRKRLFPILGLCLNAAIVLGTCGLIILGLLAG